MRFILAFGICFQLPVLLTLMGKAGLVSSQSLMRVRKYAIVAILVIAAIVTPPDVITQIILFSVVYSLYEISIFLVKLVEKKKIRFSKNWMKKYRQSTMEEYLKRIAESLERAFPLDPDNQLL